MPRQKNRINEYIVYAKDDETPLFVGTASEIMKHFEISEYCFYHSLRESIYNKYRVKHYKINNLRRYNIYRLWKNV